MQKKTKDATDVLSRKLWPSPSENMNLWVMLRCKRRLKFLNTLSGKFYIVEWTLYSVVMYNEVPSFPQKYTSLEKDVIPQLQPK